MSVLDGVTGQPVFKTIESITLSHNHVMMFVRIVTGEFWFTFRGPYNKTDYHEIDDQANNTSIFEMEFKNMRLTGYGKVDGSIKAVRENNESTNQNP